jgi:hypothetical protein
MAEVMDEVDCVDCVDVGGNAGLMQCRHVIPAFAGMTLEKGGRPDQEETPANVQNSFWQGASRF